MTEETTPSPDGEPAPEDESLGDEVKGVVESAAELGLGAVIAPFTGGETVSIVGSVASMLEAGVDRLTHLGEHETPADADTDGDRESDREDGGGGDRESDRDDDAGGDRESDRDDDAGGDRESDREDGGAAPAAPGLAPDTDGQATDGRG